jgi:hypothetical protein
VTQNSVGKCGGGGGGGGLLKFARKKEYGNRLPVL